MAGPENPPAFPVAYETSGMTLRDWFAGQAMSHALSASASHDGCYDYASAAYGAFEMAEAMLAERDARLLREIPQVEEPPSDFPEVFNTDMGAAPHDWAVMGQLADGTEKAMLWWHNWPGWRETNAYSSLGEPVTPVAWRPLTKSEFEKYEDIPF